MNEFIAALDEEIAEIKATIARLEAELKALERIKAAKLTRARKRGRIKSAVRDFLMSVNGPVRPRDVVEHLIRSGVGPGGALKNFPIAISKALKRLPGVVETKAANGRVAYHLKP